MTTECSTDVTLDSLIDILRDSQRRLADAVATLDESGAQQDSYDDDWSIAQVLSHLGSGSEVQELILDAAVAGATAPGLEQMQPIWDRWNAKSPMDQVRDALAADGAYRDRLVALPVSVRESAQLDVFGRQRSLANLVAMRIGEHAVHTWDVVVMLEPNATVQASAIEPLLTLVAEFVGYFGKTARPLRVLVRTHEPEREFVLALGPDGGRLSEPDDSPVDGTMTLSAEAFVRLIYGRLDVDHRPPLTVEGVSLDEIIAAFPGFLTAEDTALAELSIEDLARRAVGLIPAAGRAVLGITGPPGAGKSTLVAELLAALPAHAPDRVGVGWLAHVPMDGFHLADAQLDRLDLRDRKGAPETFDASGYAACLERVLNEVSTDIYVPGFERDLEQPIAAALVVPATARLVITEGNYLLLESGAWPLARATMAEVWYCDVDEALRRQRLISRHVEFGKSVAEATAWVDRSDEVNARQVAATRAEADLRVASR